MPDQTTPPPRPLDQARSPDASMARDGDMAVREEFEAAARENSLERWRLFIARHPDHALTEIARQRAASLTDD